jgi:hypothetical protein
LVKYNTGLTQAELKTKSFNEILGIILGRSAGAAEDYLSTTSYQMEVLGIATGNASEILGQGLVSAFARIGGGTEASDAATAITTIAKALAAVTVATGTVIGGFTGVFKTLKNLPKDIFMGFSRSQTGLIPKPKPAPAKPDPVNLADKKFQELLAKLEKDALKRQKELNALKLKGLATQKKLTADKKEQEVLDKASLLLAQGQKVFNEEGIQLAAAAQGKLTEEEKARLALKTDIFNLESAINEGNVTAAAQLANSMVANAQKLAMLRTDMIGLNDVQNPFSNWLATLKDMATELSKLANIKPVGTSQGQSLIIPNSRNMLGPITQDELENLAQARIDYSGFNSNMGASSGTTVVVNVAGSVSTERDLVSAITQGLYSQQASGTPVTYSTVY